MTLQNRGILITGASQGLGKAISLGCLQRGADLFLCARNAELLESTRLELSEQAQDGQRIFAEVADVSNSADVERIVNSAVKSLSRLDGLVNNAGIYGPIGPVEDVDWTEWCQAIGINLMGTVLACRAVLPVFRKNRHGKIVNLSGGGATAPMPRFSAYAASKAAVVRFTETLAEECMGANIDVNALAPGALNTQMLQQALEAGPERAGSSFYDRFLKQQASGGAPLEKAADLCAFLLSDASNGITGKLLSAVWDPWMELPSHLSDLKSTDIYNLRRIIPKDRGRNWDEP
jgi:NAD(P)-dependent dehydrogenase (short-subunit alcohol dehydrogenase family)